MRLAVIGIDALGLFTSLALSKYHEVTLYDEDNKKLSKIKNGFSYDYGEGFIKDFQSRKNRFSFSFSLSDLLSSHSIIFLCLDKINDKEEINYNPLFTMIQRICDLLSSSITLVIRTTIPIGTIEKMQKILVQMKKEHLISFVYFPYFYVDGLHYRYFSNPKNLLVGRDSDELHIKMLEILSPFLQKDSSIYYASTKEAEIIQYANYSYQLSQIQFVQEIHSICNKENIEPKMILSAIQNDPIQQVHLSKLSLSHQNDLKEWFHYMKKNSSISPNFYEQWEHIEYSILNWIQTIRNQPFPNSKCAILGLSLEGNRFDFRYNLSARIIRLLLQNDVKVFAYDSISSLFKEYYKDLKGVHYTLNIPSTIHEADYVIVLSDDQEFLNFSMQDYIVHMKKEPVIFDVIGAYKKDDMDYISYYSFEK